MSAKRKLRDPLAGKRDPVSQLYRAVRRYVQANGGAIAVASGIQIEEPFLQDGRKYVYHVVVRCVGRAPTFSKKATP
jgi:hypothetical protein